jgi:uncharacterized Zn-binding protein involved in type VI secretion
MPAACRAGADSHSCGSPDEGGSPDVFINGYPAHRRTDSHGHGATQIEASETVFINGLGLARVGDNQSGDGLLHPPNPEASGSPDVFVDGG